MFLSRLSRQGARSSTVFMTQCLDATIGSSRLGSLAATAMLAIVVGILIVQAPSGRKIAPQTFGQPRAAWGTTVTLRVRPLFGLTTDLVLARVVSALQSRALSADIAGLSVEQVGSDELRVTVPGADLSSDVNRLLQFKSIDVFDVGSDLVAEGTWIGDLAEAVGALRSPPIRYAVQADPLSGIQIVATQGEADQLLIKLGRPDGLSIPLPDGVLLVDRESSKLPRVMLVRDHPLVSAEQIESVTFEGSQFKIIPFENQRTTIAAALKSPSGTTPEELSVISDRVRGVVMSLAPPRRSPRHSTASHSKDSPKIPMTTPASLLAANQSSPEQSAWNPRLRTGPCRTQSVTGTLNSAIAGQDGHQVQRDHLPHNGGDEGSGRGARLDRPSDLGDQRWPEVGHLRRSNLLRARGGVVTRESERRAQPDSGPVRAWDRDRSPPQLWGLWDREGYGRVWKIARWDRQDRGTYD